MPIYEYECRDCGATVEVLQGARDADRSACTDCGGPLARIFSAPRLNTGNFSGPTEAGARRMSSSEETAREKVLQRSYGTLRFPPGVKHDPEGGGE